MKEFLKFMVGQLTDLPEQATLKEDSRDGFHRFVLRLSPSEAGKVIGKQGHTIRAIRSLLTAAAARNSVRASLEIEEVDQFAT